MSFGRPARLLRDMTAPRTTPIVFAILGPIGRGDLPGLCDRVRGLLAGSGADTAVCDVGTVGRPDAVTVDALARLQLAARRFGCRIQLRNASLELLELIDLMGLADVVPLGVEPGGQAEQGEERLGVEEEAELDDAAL
jgi:ABC-type transporter Mla MlaB component